MINTIMCRDAEIRFADFGAGTDLIVLLTSPQGTDPATAPPTFSVTPVDEAGNAGTPTEVYTDQHLYFSSASEFTTGAFGSLIFDFSPERGAFGGGWAYAVYSAGGRFSVGMGSAIDAKLRRCPSLSPGQASTDFSRMSSDGVRSHVDGVPAETSAETLVGGFESKTTATEEPTIGSVPTLLVLPFFQVDKNNASGTTTLYAIRNAESEAIDVEINYYPLDSSNAVRSETVKLAAGATRTVNVRDVPGLPTDPDGFARGFATIEGVDSGQIFGDFFQVDVGQNQVHRVDRHRPRRRSTCLKRNISLGSALPFTTL